jgi:CRISPR-associated protein Cas1
MLNEFVYCPRLFHLEWVEGQFTDNVDTVEGRYVHRRVDRSPSGPVPAADDEKPFPTARSVWLSSERLGLTAKVDVIETDGEEVRPVEVKRGSPPSHGPAWEPELVQLCAQGLLLIDSGFRCSSGAFYYAGSRRRVDVEFDHVLVEKTLAYVATAREAARRDVCPPPLVDSPKCPRCSLVGICLPDEVNTVARRSMAPPRRLIASRSAARPMYVTEQGATVGIDGLRLVVRRKQEILGEARLIDVSQVAVYGNVQLSAQAMRACFDRSIPVCWFSYGGWFSGIAEGLPSKNVELRRRQVMVSEPTALDLARAMIEGKIRNSRTLLRRNAREQVGGTLDKLRTLAVAATQATSLDSLLGIEGTAARHYFGQLPKMLKTTTIGDFDWKGRNRRPPTDRVNCLLSFAYGLIVKDLTSTLVAVGLDPYLGVFHQPRFGRPALALDLAEEFRPLVGDSVVVNAINNGEVGADDFIERAGGVSLTTRGRRSVVACYERRMDTEILHPVFKYRVTYRRVMEVQARLLAAVLMGEVESYRPMVTR